MADGTSDRRVETPLVGPGTTHHAGAVMLCRSHWRSPWFAPIRIGLLVFLAAVTKVLGDLGHGAAGWHHIVRALTPLALIAAVYVALHPVIIRALFARSRTGTAVEVRWAGRNRSGQPVLGLRAADGRVWRVLPRDGPSSSPPRWSGTPWLEPPVPHSLAVRGTLVHPAGTWRRGLVLHGPADAGRATDSGADVLPLGVLQEGCLGVYLASSRRVLSNGCERPRGGRAAGAAEPQVKESTGA